MSQMKIIISSNAATLKYENMKKKLQYEKKNKTFEICREKFVLLFDGPQKVEAWFDLSLRIAGLDGRGDQRHEPALGGHLVGVRHHRHVNICKKLTEKHKYVTHYNGEY